MCGLFGYFARDGNVPPLDPCRQMTMCVRHRGPDEGSYWTEGPFFLGHRRLSIIDVANAHQPMFSEDARHVLAFNGEIYNYIELRAELAGRGHRFTRTSDTEVLLAAYREWGTDMASRLVGQFAFGIVDRDAETLFLARDRAGEKPLLIWETDRALVFASELAPIAGLMGGARGLDLEGLGGYLALNYVPGTRTLMAGVRRMLPGSWELHGHTRRAVGVYWQAANEPASTAKLDPDAVVDELQHHLDQAVMFALRSDVPVGLFLSGGIDSTVVAESAVRQGRLRQAYCLDMGTPEFSEWPMAHRVATQLGLPLTRVPFDDSVLDRFYEIVEHADDPLADSSALPVWTVARAAAQDVKVVLSGDGGDELFGGYLTYPASQLHRRLRRMLPGPMRRALAAASGALPVNDSRKVSTTYKLHRFMRALDLQTSEAHFTWNGTWLPEEAALLLRAEPARSLARGALRALAAEHRLPSSPTTSELQRVDFTEYLANDILVKVDRMTMAHSLEARAPLLNPALLSYALRLPDVLKANERGHTKILLRKLCERRLGPEVAWAKKKGFSIPIHQWLRERGRTLMTDLLTPSAIERLDVFDPARIERAMRDHLKGRRALGWELWGLMVLSAWHGVRMSPTPSGSRTDDLVSVQTPIRASSTSS